MRIFYLLILLTFILPLHAQRSDFKEIDFSRADYIAERHKGENLYNLPVLAHNLTTALSTDVERFRAIYYWVCHNIEGDYNLMRTFQRAHRREDITPDSLERWRHQFRKDVFAKLRTEKRTLCTGYAYLIKELAELAGLECVIIDGHDITATSKKYPPSHAWNAVKLNGKWYLCDATWSTGYTNMANYLFEFEFDDSFFLMDPSEFAKGHAPLDSEWLLLDQN